MHEIEIYFFRLKLRNQSMLIFAAALRLASRNLLTATQVSAFYDNKRSKSTTLIHGRNLSLCFNKDAELQLIDLQTFQI